MSKGSNRRPYDADKFRDGWERIYGKPGKHIKGGKRAGVVEVYEDTWPEPVKRSERG